MPSDTMTTETGQQTEAGANSAGQTQQETGQETQQTTEAGQTTLTGQQTQQTETGQQTPPTSSTGIDFESLKGGLNDDARAYFERSGHKDVNSLVSDMLTMEKSLGADKNTILRIPKEGLDKSPEARAAINKALGVPETADGYEPVKTEDGTAVLSDEEHKALSALAHQNGVPPAAHEAYIKEASKMLAARDQAGDEAYSRENATNLENLKREWAGDYARRETAAIQAVEQYMPEGFKQFLDDTGLGNDARMIEGFSKIAEMLGEGGHGGGLMNGGGQVQMTRDQMEARIHEIEKDAALFDKNDPQHQKLTDERSKLYKALNEPKTA